VVDTKPTKIDHDDNNISTIKSIDKTIQRNTYFNVSVKFKYLKYWPLGPYD